MTRILLARHGQSEWNSHGRWQGQADPPLSDLGRKQAMLASERIGAVDAIIASDLQRAAETAFIIAEALGIGPVVTEPLLRERNVGEWSGLTRSEIEAQWPGFLEAGNRPPGWEHDEALVPRIHEALGGIHRTYGDAEVLVVAHGGLMYALEREADLRWERLENLGARWLTVDGDGVRLGDRVRLIDDELLTSVPTQI
jgi:probable phosphoglycerate mutase